METLANDNGELNQLLLIKTKGSTLLWYLLLIELDFVCCVLAGLTAISLLYLKQVASFVFNLFMAPKVTDKKNSYSGGVTGSVAEVRLIELQHHSDGDTEGDNEDEQSWETDDSICVEE